MASVNQGGSILSFLLIGGILTAVLVGGAYFVQQRVGGTTTDKAPVVVQPANQSPDQAANKPTPPADDKKVAVEPKKEEPKKEAPKAAPQTTTPPTTELPKTGPVETISSIVGAGLLSGMLVAYVRSRRTSVTL
jgi:LPXTG-motif cell wall-anchored protein